MEALNNFLVEYGWQLGLIALLSIVLLGIFKYTNTFSKLEKSKRKLVYFIITIGLSLIGSAIYLAIIDKFNIAYLGTIATALYAINQTFYSIYENTSLKDLLNKLITKIINMIKDYYNKEVEKLNNKSTDDNRSQ